MNQEHKVSVGTRIFYIILSGTFPVLGLHLYSKSQKYDGGLLFFTIIASVVAVIVAISVLRGRIKVSPNSIIRVNLFQTRELPFNDIKGFRTDGKKLRFERLTLHASDFVIWRYTDFSDTEGLMQRLRGQFLDLDQAEYQVGLNQILDDNSLGITEDERRQKLDTARIAAIAYNIGGVIVFIAGSLYFREIVKSGFLLAIISLYPLLSAVIMYFSKGLIRFYSDKKSPYYHLYVGIYLSTVVFFITSIVDYELLSYDNIWYFIPMAAVLSTVFWFVGKGKTSPKRGVAIFMVALISLFYSYGCLLQLNCHFDGSLEKVYHANVLNSYILRKNGTHPYLKIDTWGPQAKVKEIQVDLAFYNQSPIGSAVTVHLKKGVFNIPWYVISPQ
jgi:hypothetical protein